MKEGLSTALGELLDSGKTIARPGILLEAYLDKCAGERSKLGNYPGIKEKLKYIAYRYTPYMEKKINARKDIWW